MYSTNTQSAIDTVFVALYNLFSRERLKIISHHYYHYSIFKHTGTAVISLANIHVAATKDSERGVEAMLRYLMESVQNIKWVGLNAQSYTVSTINGMKVGFTAVCVSHTECSQESFNIHSSLSPVKYHMNSFTVIVKKLREVKFVMNLFM